MIIISRHVDAVERDAYLSYELIKLAVSARTSVSSRARLSIIKIQKTTCDVCMTRLSRVVDIRLIISSYIAYTYIENININLLGFRKDSLYIHRVLERLPVKTIF